MKMELEKLIKELEKIKLHLYKFLRGLEEDGGDDAYVRLETLMELLKKEVKQNE